MTDLYPKGRFAEDLYTKYIRSDVSPRRAPVGSTVRMELQFVMNAIDHKHIRTPVSYTHLTLPTKRIV